MCQPQALTVAARCKILLVDDHAGFRSTLRQLLEDDAELLEADSGEAALSAYQTGNPDWVIMDVCMPGLGGGSTPRRRFSN